jgi:hypothetical protein
MYRRQGAGGSALPATSHDERWYAYRYRLLSTGTMSISTAYRWSGLTPVKETRQVGNIRLQSKNTVYCYENIRLQNKNTVYCYENIRLQNKNTVYCYENIRLQSKNTVYCYENIRLQNKNTVYCYENIRL